MASPTHDFVFYTQAQVFENLSKSSEKRHMRIGGPIGSECEDIAKEVVVQKGLNYDDFLGLRGFFNKNHSADTLDILGAPESVKLYEAGEKMPDGQIAKHATTWVEGFLYDTAKGRETYELAKAMQGSGRSLGFSIEGHVEERSGPGNRTISKARIQNVAITHVPCNPDARLEVLLRSVSHANASGESFKKTMTIGGGPLLVAQEGYEVPIEDARPSAQCDEEKKATALQLTPEELDRRIVSVARPVFEEMAINMPGGRSPAMQKSGAPEGKQKRAGMSIDDKLNFQLQKAALIAARQAAELALDATRFDGIHSQVMAKSAPSARKKAKSSPETARKSLSNAHLLQSIFKAMPGVSIQYAQSLAETIRRDRARS